MNFQFFFVKNIDDLFNRECIEENYIGTDIVLYINVYFRVRF